MIGMFSSLPPQTQSPQPCQAHGSSRPTCHYQPGISARTLAYPPLLVEPHPLTSQPSHKTVQLHMHPGHHLLIFAFLHLSVQLVALRLYLMVLFTLPICIALSVFYTKGQPIDTAWQVSCTAQQEYQDAFPHCLNPSELQLAAPYRIAPLPIGSPALEDISWKRNKNIQSAQELKK